MKKLMVFLLLLLPEALLSQEEDSLWVRPRTYPKGMGMSLEYSADRQQWDSICGTILTSDYGPWGREKRLYNPSFTLGKDKEIALVFQLNDRDNQFGVTCSSDLIHWRPQDFPLMPLVGQCLSPVIEYAAGTYRIVFHNNADEWYATTSSDLIHFSAPQRIVSGATSTPIRLPYSLVDHLQKHQETLSLEDTLYHELARNDSERFAALTKVDATLTIRPQQSKPISNRLMGIFFEDINYAADGGLWAELLQNGDFEYSASEQEKDPEWGPLKAWTTHGQISLNLTEGISPNNPHAATMTVSRENLGASVRNMGWSGIPIVKDALYSLSIYTQGVPIKLSITNGNETLASTTIKSHPSWEKTLVTLQATSTCDSALLSITPLEAGSASIDMVSLMPQDTYKHHGLRRDLAETIEALHPKFMRFPGGCLVHGNGLDNIYHWKETIGPLEERRGAYNTWHYHQSRRLGYYEFFQMCEDMGMQPLPVVAAGTPCQNSSLGGNGQQGGIPIEEMDNYIQDVLDLIEWANGDSTTTWGAKRAAQGHPEPFHLTTIGIGNEDLISPTFATRYLMICQAVKKAYPDIEVCGTAGPFYCGADYDEGWRLAKLHHDWIDLVDEHYYLPPAWYVYNQHFYDSYDRLGPKVYLGEWAAHIPGRASTIETALSEALYFCNLERNGDIVAMSSYAPLLARKGHTQWNPDMIYFTATTVLPTVGYYAHKMCGNSQGDSYLSTHIATDNTTHGVNQRLAASTVVDSTSGHTYIKMVNLLPVEVGLHLDTGGLLNDGSYHATILTGAYDDSRSLPQDTQVNISNNQLTLPPYSFTLITL